MAVLPVAVWMLAERRSAIQESQQDERLNAAVSDASTAVRNELNPMIAEALDRGDRYQAALAESERLRQEESKRRDEREAALIAQVEEARRSAEGNATAASKAASQAAASARVLTPRVISAAQRALFLSRVPKGRHGTIGIIATMGDTEATEYATAIGSLLRDGGFDVEESLAVFSGPMRGVMMRIHARDAMPAYAVGLQKLLQDIGIEAVGVENKQTPSTRVDLLVGSRSPAEATAPRRDDD